MIREFMVNPLKFLLCLLTLCIFLGKMQIAAYDDNYKPAQIEHQIIQNPYKKEENLEFFMLKPADQTKTLCPVIFLLHGYQPLENSIGGKQLVEYGYLEFLANEGIVAVSVSIPGYGKSTGKRDFGGPDSQDAIIAVINHVKNLPFIDSSKMGIYGISRGAQLAGMVSSHYQDMIIQILESGFYDLVSFQSDTPNYLEGIKNSIIQEGGNTLEALIERSHIYYTDDVNASTLILQGEFDDRRQLPATQKLHQLLLKQGIDSVLKIYSGELHVLPASKWETIIPFVREHFFNLYGIGIKVSEATPAMQILKIHPNSPASHEKKLKVGDAILSISPMNDDVEISTLRMPTNKFISLVLGKKDSSLGLQIQHFDLSIENIVIQRG